MDDKVIDISSAKVNLPNLFKKLGEEVKKEPDYQGELTAIAIVGMTVDGNAFLYESGDSIIEVLGLIEMLRHKVTSELVLD